MTPHSIEAEQQVLGAILLGQPTTEVEAVGGADIFYDPVHAAIYKLCKRLERDGREVTPVTVSASLSADLEQSLSSLGGKRYLARMAGAAISPGLVGEYAGVIAEAKAKRQIQEAMKGAQDLLSAGELSASDVAAQLESGLQAIGAAKSRITPVSMMRAVTDALEDVQAAYDGAERNVVSSGIIALDRMVPGFGPGQMWLVGGRPSMGKTAVALSMGLAAARAGHPVVIASLEMTPQSMALRALSEATSRQGRATPYTDLYSGAFDEHQHQSLIRAAKEIAELPITFLPREYQDTDLLQVGVKQTLKGKMGGKLPLIIVDYAQLLKSKANTRYEQITDVSLALKGMAMSLECPVIALSQLSRSLESRDDKRPMLSDLRESGQLEQDADGVMFCYRDEYYLEREEPEKDDLEAYADWMAALDAKRNHLEIIVAKQRQGPIGTAHVRFNPALNLIWENE